MKITILSGSPRRNGNSVYLARQFMKGAEEAGHEVFFFDCAAHNINGCLGCNHCGMSGECVQKDDFDIVRPHLLDADVIVLATPIYYFSFTSQLKKVTDRFYAINGKLLNKKSVLLASMANPSERVASLAVAVYQSIANFLHWQDKGHILATHLWNPEDIRNTDFGKQAYELGKNIK